MMQTEKDNELNRDGAVLAEEYAREQMAHQTPEEQARLEDNTAPEMDKSMFGIGKSSVADYLLTPEEEEVRDNHLVKQMDVTRGRALGSEAVAQDEYLTRPKPENQYEATLENELEKAEDRVERQAEPEERSLARDPDRPPSVPM